MKETDVLQMNREQLIDFLVKNWSELMMHVPEERKYSFFENESGNPTEMLRAVAIDISKSHLAE